MQTLLSIDSNREIFECDMTSIDNTCLVANCKVNINVKNNTVMINTDKKK
jgi:hypothetical protein